MYSVLAKQDSYAAYALRDTASTTYMLCNGLHWTAANDTKGHMYVLTFICLLPSYLITVPLKTKTADEVSVVYIKEILPKTSCSKFYLTR